MTAQGVFVCRVRDAACGEVPVGLRCSNCPLARRELTRTAGVLASSDALRGLPDFLRALANSPILQYGPLTDSALVQGPETLRRWAKEVEATFGENS